MRVPAVQLPDCRQLANWPQSFWTFERNCDVLLIGEPGKFLVASVSFRSTQWLFTDDRPPIRTRFRCDVLWPYFNAWPISAATTLSNSCSRQVGLHRPQWQCPHSPPLRLGFGVSGGTCRGPGGCQIRLYRFQWHRSEERRVGKECRSRWSPDH